MYWKEEAFASLTDVWGMVYGIDSDSYKLLSKIQENFFLVNVVDNDFICGDMPKLFETFMEENKESLS